MRRYLAVLLLAIGVGLTLTTAVLLILARDSAFPSAISGSYIVDLLFTVLISAWSIVGAVLALRLPRNAVGWVFLAIGIAAQFIELPSVYVSLASEHPDAVVTFVLWLTLWTWVLPIALIGIVIALVPDGHLPSPRWRILYAFAALVILMGPGFALTPGPMAPLGIANPFGVDSLITESTPLVGDLVLFALIFGAAGALIARLRRSRGLERAQLKWITWAAAFFAAMVLISSVAYSVDPRSASISGALAAFAMCLFPIAVGIAILRYRLYDIDLVVRRAIVYGSLSAVIAGTYLAVVVLLQTILRPFTGGSEIAVAGSTLLTLGLVQPLRHRIQRAVDRRFYRSRYDAARTLDAFTSRLRNEVDLETVRRDVLDVIGSTVTPAHANVWLRKEERPS